MDKNSLVHFHIFTPSSIEWFLRGCSVETNNRTSCNNPTHKLTEASDVASPVTIGAGSVWTSHHDVEGLAGVFHSHCGYIEVSLCRSRLRDPEESESDNLQALHQQQLKV